MGLIFRKSLSLGKGVRLNFSKKGLGISAGIKGARFGVGSRGVYSSTSIPGTGLYSINYLGSESKSVNKIGETKDSKSGCLIYVAIIVGLILAFSVPVIGIPMLVLGGVWYFFWNKQPQQQAKQKLLKARKLLSQQKFDEAAEFLKEAHDLDKENNDVTYLLGAILHNSDQFKQAIVYLKKYLEQNPMDRESQLALANCFYKTGDYRNAVDILQMIPQDFTQNLKVIQLLGASFAAEGKYDLAIDVFKKAPLLKRTLDDDLIELHYNLALIYEESGDKKNALKHFKKVYSQNINYRDVTAKVEKLEKMLLS